MITLTEDWTRSYPEAAIGIAAFRHVVNPDHHDKLDERRRDLEKRLRERYGSQDRTTLKQNPVIQAYAAYYRRFGKTYHIQLQLESVAFKAKSIPRVSSLVEAMFMAELQNLILTAGHDLDRIRGKLVADVATGSETYGTLDGREQTLKPNDMFIHDDEGILSSVLYGPDSRTRIAGDTSRVVFTVYAPAGIEPGEVADHLRDLQANVRLVAPQAEVEAMEVHTKSGSAAVDLCG
jgi:DNA/RNA-binding domain of Phe-tRNA-synthetase-like protein